jgi:hypothetical protein
LAEGFGQGKIAERPSLQAELRLAGRYGWGGRGAGGRQQATDGEEEKRKAFHVKERENRY